MGQGKRLILCGTCGSGDGRALADAVRQDMPEGVTVELAECLNLCAQPLAMALRGPGRDAYLFGGLTSADDMDLARLVRLWNDAPNGRIEDARPAGRLRHCLVGRIPG